MKQFSKDLGNVSLAPSGKWSDTKEYERLALVYNDSDNLSYIAKTNVPVGASIDNRKYWQPMNATGYGDNNFINLTTVDDNNQITAYDNIEEAIANVLPINRRIGAVLSFYNLNSDRLDRQTEFELWQFNSTDLGNWENVEYWQNIYYNWNVFVGWYVGIDALENHVASPEVGQYAYVGPSLSDSILYQCRTKNVWTNTGTNVHDYISITVGGNVTIGENGNWIADGRDTGIPATPKVDEQLDNIVLQLKQHSQNIVDLQEADKTLGNNINTVNANLQKQISSNDADIANLNSKHESLSKTVQEIIKSGEATSASRVIYDNTQSGLTSANAQAVFDELAAKNKEQDKAIDTKAKQSDVQASVSELKAKDSAQDSEIAKKADSTTVEQYKKDIDQKQKEQDAEIAKKANAEDVNQKINDQNIEINKKANFVDVEKKNDTQDAEIAKKANITDVKQKNDEQDVTIESKASKTEVDNKNNEQDAEIAKKANTEDVNKELAKKADAANVNSELAKKANTTEVNSELAKKFDKENIAQELGNAEDKVLSQEAQRRIMSKHTKYLSDNYFMLADGYYINDSTYLPVAGENDYVCLYANLRPKAVYTFTNINGFKNPVCFYKGTIANPTFVEARNYDTNAGKIVTSSEDYDFCLVSFNKTSNYANSKYFRMNYIYGAELDDNVISTAKIQDNAISNPKIANGAVNTDKIADGSVTEAKLADAVKNTIAAKANAEEVKSSISTLETKVKAIPIVKSDEEDLTSEVVNGNNILKFKDREVDADNFQSQGYVVLRKNLVKQDDGTYKNILTQDMINKSNTTYEIRYDFDLNGATINIQDNCTFNFEGGHLKNGTIVGNNTTLINFEDELRDENSIKYDGSFICRHNFVYETIATARNYISFPGKIVSTIGYTFLNDNGGCRYKVVTVEQASAANSYFANYWLYTDYAAKTGMFVPIEDERLWLMYADSKTEVNLSVFGIIYDAKYYNESDKLWYSDKEFTSLATDNSKNFQAAIGQTKWWSLKMIPSVYVLSDVIVINNPLILGHGTHSFILKGTGFREGRITTNKEIESLIYNIYSSSNDITSLTGTFYHFNNIEFDGNYKTIDCLVVKNGYEADSIECCGFFNAKENGIRMWGISSTFKVNNITTGNNGLYGICICSSWTHNEKEYIQNVEGQISLFEVSGDNNKALIGIDIKGDGSSINIQNLKCEDRSTVKTDHCTIYIKNISTASGVNIIGAFSNTETPFLIIDKDCNFSPNLRLINIFNNCNDDTKSLIIDDRKLGKKVYNHSKGNSCVSIIYRDNFDSCTFKTGLSQYSNGKYNGGLINDINFKSNKSLEEFNNAFDEYRTGYSGLTTIKDNDNGILFTNNETSWVDVFGNILNNELKVTITCTGDNYWNVIDLEKYNRDRMFKVTVKSINFNGYINFYTSNNSNPQRTIKEKLNVTANSDISFYSSDKIIRYLILNFKGANNGDKVIISILVSVNLPLAIADIDERVHYSMPSSGSDFPKIDNTYQGKSFVINKNKYIVNSEGKWVLESKGVEYNKYGDTDNRPQLDSSMEGFEYYDSTLKKKILWNGTDWVNLDGTVLS